MKEHITAIKKILLKAITTEDLAELEAYKDIAYTDLPSKAVFVVKPYHYEDIKKLLEYCNEHMLVVVPWGGGTNLSGSLSPERPFIALDLKGLNCILDFSEEDEKIKVQAGATIEKVESYLNKKGYTLGHDSWSRASATIGGAIALDSAGNLYPKYGSAGDLILSLKIALADGRIIDVGNEVTKTSSSPRLISLFTGSAGTLGVILDATFKIKRLPEHHDTLGYAFPTFKDMLGSLKELLKAGLEPQCYIGGTLPKAMIKLQPRAEQALVKMLGIDSALFVYYEGNRAEVDVRLKESRKILKKFGKEMPEKYSQGWWQKRHTYFEMSKELADESIYLHVFDFCVPKGRVIDAHDQMNMIASKFGISDRISHSLFSAIDAYTVALYLKDDRKSRELLKHFEKKAFQVVHDLKGTIARTHGLGSLYRDETVIEKEIGADELDILTSLKEQLDPNNILNPGIIIKGRENERRG